jgi:hypothetical protein
MRTIAMLALSLPLWGQLSVSCPSTIVAGATLNCSAMLSGSAPAINGVTWVLPPSLGTPVITAGTAAVAAGKIIKCNGLACIVYGINTTTMAAGELEKIAIPIPSTLQGNIQIGLTGAAEGDAQGNAIVVTVNPPVTVSVSPSLSKCDVNGDGQINSADVAVMLDSALGISPVAHDLNGSGFTTVLDVQIVIYAAQGLGCNAI